MAKIDGGTKDNGSRSLDEVELVRAIQLAEIIGEGCFVADEGVDFDRAGDTGVDIREETEGVGAEETLMRYKWLLRHRRQTCTYRSALENIFGTETETGRESFEGDDDDDGGGGVGLDEEGAGLDERKGMDLVEDELGAAETGLGLIDGFGFGRWEVRERQLWSFGKRC